MKNKLEQVNQSYKKALGQILRKEFPDIVELTVYDVLIDPSYQNGRVWLRTTPEVLKMVEDRRVAIQAQIKKYVQTRYTPKLTFLLDQGDIEKVEDLFRQLEEKS